MSGPSIILNPTPPLTLPVQINDSAKGKIRCACLRHAKTFLSSNFSGKTAVVSFIDGRFRVGTPEEDKKRGTCSKVFFGTLKVVGWLTVILPLIAYIAAKIFHSLNPMINEAYLKGLNNNEQLQSQMADRLRIIEDMSAEAKKLKEDKEIAEKALKDEQIQCRATNKLFNDRDTRLRELLAQGDIKEVQEKLKTAQTDLKSKKDEVERLRIELDDKNRKALEPNPKLLDANRSVELLTNKVHASTEQRLAETGQLRTKIKELENTIAKQEGDIKFLNQTIVDKTFELTKNSLTAMHLSAAQAKEKELEERIKTLTSTISENTAEIERQKAEATKAITALETQRKAFDLRSEEDKKKAEGEITALNGRIRTLESNLSHVTAEAAKAKEASAVCLEAVRGESKRLERPRSGSGEDGRGGGRPEGSTGAGERESKTSADSPTRVTSSEPVSETEEKSKAEERKMKAFASGSMEEYLEACGGHISREEVETSALIGYKWLKAILQDTRSTEEIVKEEVARLNSLPEAQRNNLLSGIVWFLMSNAIKKGEGFDDGAFIIPDEGHRLFLILHQMKNKDTENDRLSSHLKDQQAELLNFFQEHHRYTKKYISNGIDISPSRDQIGLPRPHTTVLFMPVQSDGRAYIFIKPEQHGVKDWWDTFEHAKSTFKSVTNRWWGVPPPKGSRKERIRGDLSALFSDIVKGLPGADEAIKKVGYGDKGRGIHAMVQFINEKLSRNECNRRTEMLKGFLADLNRQYADLQDRYGDEVRLPSLKTDLAKPFSELVPTLSPEFLEIQENLKASAS